MSAVVDADGVSRFVAGLIADLDQCETREGMVCATADSRLRHAARLCQEFSDRLRQWAMDVFRDRVPFDEAVEARFRAEGQRLLGRCREKLVHGQELDRSGVCYVLGGLEALEPAVRDLDRLVTRWVRPMRSVTPGPRAKPRVADADTVARLASLPPLPRDWVPVGVQPARGDG